MQNIVVYVNPNRTSDSVNHLMKDYENTTMGKH